MLYRDRCQVRRFFNLQQTSKATTEGADQLIQVLEAEVFQEPELNLVFPRTNAVRKASRRAKSASKQSAQNIDKKGI